MAEDSIKYTLSVRIETPTGKVYGIPICDTELSLNSMTKEVLKVALYSIVDAALEQMALDCEV